VAVLLAMFGCSLRKGVKCVASRDKPERRIAVVRRRQDVGATSFKARACVWSLLLPPESNVKGPKTGVWMILFCAADLLWASKIKGTADALGIPCRPVRNLEMLEARLGDSPVRALIVDLESDAGHELIKRVRAGAKSDSERSIRVVAFGPHVEVDRLAQAKADGADVTMPRGAFARRLPAILTELKQST
jgi:hypothetical protein